MQAPFSLKATKRQSIGTGANRRLRRENQVPAILYGSDQQPLPITLSHFDVSKSLKNEAFYSHILEIDVDGQVEKVVVKSIQRHPSKAVILHMDFLRISDKHPIMMRVPLHFTGEDIAPGVKLGGGKVFHLMNDIEIKCLPKNLPEHLVVDISQLEIEQSLHLSDIQLPKGVEISSLQHGPEHDLPIVSIHKPKTQVVEEPTAETLNETAEKSSTESQPKSSET